MTRAEITSQLRESDEADSRLDGASLDVAVEKRRELLELLPEARAEGDKIDFERLRRALGDSVETGKERYGLTWPGKAECFKTIQAPSMATLLPVPVKSVNFDMTENLIIEGDNLEVLKLLQKPYLGKAKLIYLDAPYNTGGDFIYPDDYSESLRTYLEYTGQVDSDGKRFGTNTDADGRFHSKWLNMMYPRVYLARNLLREDGVLFLSIDDHEAANARLLINEIFGEENFVEQIVWKKRYNAAKEKHLASIHEYILMYARNIETLAPIYITASKEYISKYFVNRDDHYELRGGFRTQPLEAGNSMDDRPNLVFPVSAPDGSEILPRRQWVWSKERTKKALENDELHFSKERRTGKWSVRFKQYERDAEGVDRGVKPFSIIDDIFYQDGTKEITEIFGEQVFSFPKPVALIKRLMQFAGVGDGDLVLDLFAGSGTTAHAVLELNEDGADRKFLLVQLPEPTDRKDYTTIIDICEERVRRIISKRRDVNGEELNLREATQDTGFRVFKLAESNVKEWDASVPHEIGELKSQLELAVDHVRHDRSDLDIVYEVLLKSGYPLSAKVLVDTLGGRRVYSVSEGAFLICLERELTLDLVREVAARKPERVLFLDVGFAANDQLKANAVQTFTSRNIVFRTL